jgi:hypothetical protein
MSDLRTAIDEDKLEATVAGISHIYADGPS